MWVLGDLISVGVGYTDASRGFAVAKRDLRGQLFPEGCERRLDLPVHPEGVGLAGEAGDLLELQVLLVTHLEEQALRVR
jgi:hypothetical protein